MKKLLEIKNLTKYYGSVLGVKDLSLSLNEGEIFGFIGPNGAGKSTTIRAIMNLINKTGGEVLIDGKVFGKEDIELKKLIGYLPSEVNLYEDMTVREMLDYHASFYKQNLTKRKEDLVSRLSLDENKKIEELSFGNLKKLAIVLSLMHNPKILILDEATSGLDPIMQQEFFKILKEEKAKGTTIFYSTHILSEVSKVCDRVGIIKEGRLLTIEKVEELKRKNLELVTITSKEVSKLVDSLNVDVTYVDDDTIKFKNEIEINKLLKELSKYKIEKILIEEATLEEMFLHYYK